METAIIKNPIKFQIILLILGLFCLFNFGCWSYSTRYREDVQRGEINYDYTITHKWKRIEAFDRIELWLAENYVNLNEIAVLKRPDSGTFVLKPTVQYVAGVPGGQKKQWARYTLKIQIGEPKISLHFELGPEVRTGYWAPTGQIPVIRNNFESIRDGIASAVDGTVSP